MLSLVIPTATAPANEQGGRHPDAKFISESVRTSHTVRLNGPRAAAGLRLAAVSATIGVEDGSDHLIFNRIDGVAVTRAGNIVVMDAKANELRVFDRTGKFVERIGRAGDGPGEFRNPAAIVVTPRDELLVVDLRRRLSTFVKGPQGYRIANTVTLPFGVQSMCYLRNELVAASRSEKDSAVVAVLDSTGAVKRRFGRLYQSPNSYVNVTINSGRVACDETSGLVFFTPKNLIGDIRAYRLDGTPVWRTTVSDLSANVLLEQSDGGIAVESRPNSAGVHNLSGFVMVPGVGLVTQYDFLSNAQLRERDVAGVRFTVVLNPNTGQAVLSDQPVPVIGAVGPRMALLTFDAPFPRVEIRAFSAR
jgi:hypothetical protein